MTPGSFWPAGYDGCSARSLLVLSVRPDDASTDTPFVRALLLRCSPRGVELIQDLLLAGHNYVGSVRAPDVIIQDPSQLPGGANADARVVR